MDYQPGLQVLIIVKWLQQNWQALIDEGLQWANMKHLYMDYQPRLQVLIIVKDPDKLAPQNLGPYQIEMGHVNDTVTIEWARNIFECIFIQRIQPDCLI